MCLRIYSLWSSLRQFASTNICAHFLAVPLAPTSDWAKMSGRYLKNFSQKRGNFRWGRHSKDIPREESCQSRCGCNATKTWPTTKSARRWGGVAFEERSDGNSRTAAIAAWLGFIASFGAGAKTRAWKASKSGANHRINFWRLKCIDRGSDWLWRRALKIIFNYNNRRHRKTFICYEKTHLNWLFLIVNKYLFDNFLPFPAEEKVAIFEKCFLTIFCPKMFFVWQKI